MQELQRINVGAYEVITSGLVSTASSDPVVLVLDPKIIVRLVFENKGIPGSKESTVSSSINESGELEYRLVNFNNPLGTEFTQLAEIGTFKGRKLYFHVKVLGNETVPNKTILYTFYSGGEVTNG